MLGKRSDQKGLWEADRLYLQDDCKVSELDRRGGRWSGLGGRRKS